MKSMLRTIYGSATFALVLTSLAAAVLADDAKVPQNPEELVKAMAEAGKPGPQHAKLEPLAGNWTYTCKFWMDPSQPPMESKGTIERKWILGGRFLEEKVVGKGFDGKSDFEGFGLLGYDNGRQKFTSNWACSMGTSTCNGLGVSNASGEFTFQTEAFCPLRKETIQGREEIRFEGDDKVVTESYVIEDGKEVKMMELICIRKK